MTRDANLASLRERIVDLAIQSVYDDLFSCHYRFGQGWSTLETRVASIRLGEGMFKFYRKGAVQPRSSMDIYAPQSSDQRRRLKEAFEVGKKASLTRDSERTIDSMKATGTQWKQ